MSKYDVLRLLEQMAESKTAISTISTQQINVFIRTSPGSKLKRKFMVNVCINNMAAQQENRTAQRKNDVVK
jgi:hypothetical protein